MAPFSKSISPSRATATPIHPRNYLILPNLYIGCAKDPLDAELLLRLKVRHLLSIVPDHPAIVHAARHDYEGFARHELALREELGYPPYGRLLRVLFEDKDPRAVKEAAQRFGDALFEPVAREGGMVLGPTEAPMALVRGRTRHHLLVKAPEGSAALARARAMLMELASGLTRPRVTVDIDPVGML